MTKKTMFRRFIVSVALVLLSLVAATAWYVRRPSSAEGFVARNVPAASGMFDARSQFAPSLDGWVAKGAIAGGQQPDAPDVKAPALADGSFRLDSPLLADPVAIRLAGAAAVPATRENRALVYKNVHPSVDLIALHDPSYFELALVAYEQPSIPIELELELGENDELRKEPGTGAVLVVHNGRARLRIARPVAYDAAGQEKQGAYEIHDRRLAIALPWHELQEPIVIDPKIAVPVFSILHDGRSPGQRTYDAERVSREAVMANDTSRDRAVLVRPARSQQLEDTIFMFGDASRDYHFSNYQFGRWLGLADAEEVTTQVAEELEWQRGYLLESETWEWDGQRWTLNDSARLPGILGASMAFDPKRSRMVLFGGARPGLHCRNALVAAPQKDFYCGNEEQEDAFYEYDGFEWERRTAPGMPPARLRPAMAWDAAAERLVVFGGRALDSRRTLTFIGPKGHHLTNSYGRPFPESLSRDLLNDTWTFDGGQWRRIPTQTPPPASEGAQLVSDPFRRRLILVPGHSDDAAVNPSFSLWEFDGADWTERIRAGAEETPVALRNRRSMTAFWNPVRKRTMLFGGNAERLASCQLTPQQVESQLAVTENDPVAREQLAATGCLGGYVHDLWEWDGNEIAQVTNVQYGGMARGNPVFRQIAQGTEPWTEGEVIDESFPVTVNTPALPWRYDDRRDHFALRTTLERAFAVDSSSAPAVPSTALAPPSGPAEFASPLFASSLPLNAMVTAQGRVQFHVPDGDKVFGFNGTAWAVESTRRSPFDAGPNDFFAAVWDSSRQQVVLYDPTLGETWLYSDAQGWSTAAVSSPPRWALAPEIRTEEHLPHVDPDWSFYSRFHERVASAGLAMPKMTFDRARQRAVMLYASAVWEWDGVGWIMAAPMDIACKAAWSLAYDGVKQRTVAFGCTVPSQTWEWDGSAGAGPFPGPHVAKVKRDRGYYATWEVWKAPVQTAWAHPNSVFESTTLGGVSTLDADGTLRTWTGGQWAPGPRLPDGYSCKLSEKDLHWFQAGGDDIPVRPGVLGGYDFIPLCLFPPVVEDTGAAKVIAFRDGRAGMMALNLEDLPDQREWAELPVEGNWRGHPWLWGMWSRSLVHPYPLELMSPEHAYLQMRSDPQAREFERPDHPYLIDPNRASELQLSNLMWPYRLLKDETSGRVRVLTHRGLMWELRTYPRKGLGETCQSTQECGDGVCTQEGVCCNTVNCGQNICSTCVGAVRGKCEYRPGLVGPDSDSNPCTEHVCTDRAQLALRPLSHGTACSDGNACNGQELCNVTIYSKYSFSASCEPGSPPELDDNNPCTTDTCDPSEGVIHQLAAAGTSCSDGNACNGVEQCTEAGQCVASAAPVIDDGDPCTLDSCDPTTGPKHVRAAVGAACSYASAHAGTCNAAGQCVPTSDPAHEDGNPCTFDYANDQGVQHDALAGVSCSDGDRCNGDEACSEQGACVASAAPVVNDSDPATLDMCDFEKGVVHKIPSTIDRILPTSIAKSNAFLYQGDDALQIGVSSGALNDDRTAVVHGRVLGRDGLPIESVRVTVHRHPELGRTATRPDGAFDMVVNGGDWLTVSYEKTGYLPVHRLVRPRSRQHENVDDVVMTALDPDATPIDPSSTEFQVAVSAVQVDGNGSRQAALLFEGGTEASMKLRDGTELQLASLGVRITEYSVGSSGPGAVPATLPPQTGYAYAVELSVDEAISANALEVSFSQPVRVYVDNFLSIPSGTEVPIGYCDHEEAQWRAAENGVVMTILGESNGVAALDTDGDEIADDEAYLLGLGISVEERQVLAAHYEPGWSLWRVQVHHFSPYAIGWGWSAPACARAPGGKSECDTAPEFLPLPSGNAGPSVTKEFPVHGADQTLVYDSSRMPGDKRSARLTVPLSNAQLPPGLKAIELDVAVAGRSHHERFESELANRTRTFEWNREDGFERVLQGEQRVVVAIGYVYECDYRQIDSFGLPGGATKVSTDMRQGCRATLWREWSGSIGSWDPSPQGLGGFTLSEHHAYDVDNGMLYFGTGQSVAVGDRAGGVDVFAGGLDAGIGSDLLPRTESLFNWITGLAPAADGSLFLVDRGNQRIAKIRPDGLVETVVNGVLAYAIAIGPDDSVYYTTKHQVWRRLPNGTVAIVAGDGAGCGVETVEVTDPWKGPHQSICPTCDWLCNVPGKASLAHLQAPYGLAVAPGGDVYVSDYETRQVLQITPAGDIFRVAGTAEALGTSIYTDGFSTEVDLRGALGIALDPDGSLLIADATPGRRNAYPQRLRRLETFGWLDTAVNAPGQVCATDSGDGYPGWTGCLGEALRVATAPDGSAYVLSNQHIRKLSRDRMLTTEVDAETWHWDQRCGDDELYQSAILRWMDRAIAVDAKGTLYWVNGCANQRIMRMRVGPKAGKEIKIPSPDASEVFVFNSEGRHERTEVGRFGVTKRRFSYTPEDRLASEVDPFGNQTSLERTGDQVQRIVGHYGQATKLAADPAGFLDGVTNPADETKATVVSSAGMLQSSGDALGQTTVQYGADGLPELVDEEGPSSLWVESTSSPAGSTTTLRTAGDVQASRQEQALADGSVQTVVTGTDNLATVEVVRPDHSWTAAMPDGTIVEGTYSQDPQYGAFAPYANYVAETTPGQLKRETRTAYAAEMEAEQGTWTGEEAEQKLVKLTTEESVNGKVTKSILDTLAGTLQTISPKQRKVTRYLDARARPTIVVTPGAEPLRFEYDSRGNLAMTVQGSRRTEYSYDAAGHPSEVSGGCAEGTGLPITRCTTRIVYHNDKVGRPLGITLNDSRTISMGYDEHGNLLGVTPPEGDIHLLTYWPGDEMKAYTPPALEELPGVDLSARYDYAVDGQLARIQTASGREITFGLDEFGRTNTVTTPERTTTVTYSPTSGLVESLTTSDGITLTTRRDGPLPTSETWSGPVSGEVRWQYNNDFLVREEKAGEHTIGYRYDDDGLVEGAGELQIVRDPATGRINSTSVGVVADQASYNDYGQLVGYEARYISDALYSMGFEFDDLGRITTKTETVGGSTHTYAYHYDKRGWLEQLTKNDEVIASWTYDANGNRVDENARHDEHDRLLQWGSRAYQYDRDGMLSATIDPETSPGAGVRTTSFAYDTTGNLIAVSFPDGRQIEYLTDPLGRRIGKKSGGVLVERLLWRSALQPVQWEKDGVVSRFVYGLGRNVPDYMVRGSEEYRLITDQVGSVRLVVNAVTGEIAQRIDYDPWGVVLQDTNPGFQPFAFAGGLYDPDTGLVRFGARDYDPAIGRWTAKDPLLFGGGDTNLYVYAGGDPVNQVDPTGNFAWAAWALWGMVGSAPFWVSNSDDWGGYAGMALTGLAVADAVTLGSVGLRSLAGRAGYNRCFVGDTPVLTARGFLRIDQVRVGDEVWSHDNATERWSWRRVENTFVHAHEGELITIETNGQRVTATRNHPFCVENGSGISDRPLPSDIPVGQDSCGAGGRWVEAADLMIGDTLVPGAGATAVVSGLSAHLASAPVYNIEVQGSHTYTVGRGGILVHNKAAPFGPIARRAAWNRSAGNAARDAVGDNFRMWGYHVQPEVYTRSLFGVRRHDLVVWESFEAFTARARPIANLEVKLGAARYSPYQRVQDAYIRWMSGVPTYLVRVPR